MNDTEILHARVSGVRDLFRVEIRVRVTDPDLRLGPDTCVAFGEIIGTMNTFLALLGRDIDEAAKHEPGNLDRNETESGSGDASG